MSVIPLDIAHSIAEAEVKRLAEEMASKLQTRQTADGRILVLNYEEIVKEIQERNAKSSERFSKAIKAIAKTIEKEHTPVRPENRVLVRRIARKEDRKQVQSSGRQTCSQKKSESSHS